MKEPKGPRSGAGWIHCIATPGPTMVGPVLATQEKASRKRGLLAFTPYPSRYLRPMFQELLVVETASVLAGPSAGMFFAELGARVVKLENPRHGGDVTRSWKVPGESPTAPVSAYFSSVNLRKELLSVDLTTAAGQTVLQPLLAAADVLITNHLPHQAERLGLGRDLLRAVNPRLVHGHIRGYADQPERPAFDVVLQAETGYLAMTGSDEERLAKMPVAMIDVLAGHQLKEGLLLALMQRARTGVGAYVEVCLEEAALAGLVNQASNHLMTGHVPRPLGTLHPNIAPYGEVFRCRDGGRVVLAVGSDAQFAGLCQVLGRNELPQDPRFRSNTLRVQERGELARELAPVFATRDRAELLQALALAGVPAGAVRTMPEALAGAAAQRMLREEVIEGVATRRLSGNAFRITPL